MSENTRKHMIFCSFLAIWWTHFGHHSGIILGSHLEPHFTRIKWKCPLWWISHGLWSEGEKHLAILGLPDLARSLDPEPTIKFARPYGRIHKAPDHGATPR